MVAAQEKLSVEMDHAIGQIEETAQGLLGANIVFGATPTDFLDSFKRLARVLAVNPRIVAKKQVQMGGELVRIMLGRSHIKPPPHDLRFKHPIWRENAYYKRVMQSYLVWRKAMFDILASADADERDKDRAKFILMQITAAAAPTNNPLGNPGFVDNLIKTRGKSVINGVRNFVHDMRHNNRMPRQIDKNAFTVGKDLATSQGAVVFRNEVCEIIQYRPRTEKVYSKPVLIVPPQINKYYIIDLAPDKSFVKYATDNGVQVFTISWRNPTAEHRDWDFDTYVATVIEAIDAVREISGQYSIDLIGACAGGMTLLATLAYLETQGQQGKVDRLTLLVTLTDASVPTLMGLFASDTAMKAARQYVQRQGVVDGADMGRVFAWLRPAELVWLFFANNYIMGNDPPKFDFLYWNNDSTRLPAGFHADAIELFEQNPFMSERGFKVLGETVDPHKIDRDSFIVSGIKDHIVPWRSSYAATQVLSGNKRFVLGTAGHIQAVVTPPDKKGAGFYVNDNYPADADQWLHNAEQHEGSWWVEWIDWLTSGRRQAKNAPSELGSEQYPPGEPAPGRYVLG